MNFYLKSSQHSRWHTYLVQSYRWAAKSHTRKVINCKCKFTQPLAQSRRTNTRVTSFILFSGCGSCDIRNTQDALYQTWATTAAVLQRLCPANIYVILQASAATFDTVQKASRCLLDVATRVSRLRRNSPSIFDVASGIVCFNTTNPI